jgi:dolichyl-phosphate beta-glucosyltransferase
MDRPRASAPDLSVVIPAYNESRRLGASLDRILGVLPAPGFVVETIVVDDGSTDGTAAVASAHVGGWPGRVVVLPTNRGKGHAVRRGLLEAAAPWVLVTDADLSCPIEEYRSLSEAARTRGLDVVIGSRALPGSRVVEAQHPVRAGMGKAFNYVLRPMTGLPFRDTQCGFKLLNRERVRPLVDRLRVDGFAYDVELLVLCRRAGLRVGEVPVVWRNSPASHVRLLRDPVRMLLDLVRIWWRLCRGVYDAGLDRAEGPAPSGDGRR